MTTYKTFLRSATSFETAARARKITQETGLTYDEAKEHCKEYNENRSAKQVRKGTKLEFTAE